LEYLRKKTCQRRQVLSTLNEVVDMVKFEPKPE
jgi:hypothetical protein